MALFAEIERLGAAGKVVFSARAAQGTTWRDEGHRCAAAWMAQTTGTGLGEAMGTLETAEALRKLPRDHRSAASGGAVGLTGEGHRRRRGAPPRDREGPVGECRDPRVSRGSRNAPPGYGPPPPRRRPRTPATSPSSAGGTCGTGPIPTGPSASTPGSRPTPGRRSSRPCRSKPTPGSTRPAKRTSTRALPPIAPTRSVALVTGESAIERRGSRSGPQTTVSIRVDAAALKRGHAKAGETCHIAGVGPVPVSAVRRQLADAFVKILVVDGEDVTTVAHPGRTVTAQVQSALEERDPCCVVPGCDTAEGLQNHHWDVDYVTCKTTSLAGLARRVPVAPRPDHLREVGAQRGAGGWEWRAPPGGCEIRDRATAARQQLTPLDVSPMTRNE